MQIEFYEEFPTKENLEKLKLIKFKTRLFIAAKYIEEFKQLEKQSKQIKKDLDIAYWPIIKNSYWISPFSNTKDLIETFSELNKIPNHLLIDLELPNLNLRLLLKNIPSFWKNKRLIKNFLEKNKERITTAEVPHQTILFLIKALGLKYKINNEKSIMWYSSMLGNTLNHITKKCLSKIKNKNNYSVSLGTIAAGILGNEPILHPDKLEEDLEFVKKAGFKKVIIFRLGGLNKEYIKIINKFQR